MRFDSMMVHTPNECTLRGGRAKHPRRFDPDASHVYTAPEVSRNQRILDPSGRDRGADGDVRRVATGMDFATGRCIVAPLCPVEFRRSMRLCGAIVIWRQR
jgi:hypothetical protein